LESKKKKTRAAASAVAYTPSLTKPRVRTRSWSVCRENCARHVSITRAPRARAPHMTRHLRALYAGRPPYPARVPPLQGLWTRDDLGLVDIQSARAPSCGWICHFPTLLARLDRRFPREMADPGRHQQPIAMMDWWDVDWVRAALHRAISQCAQSCAVFPSDGAQTRLAASSDQILRGHRGGRPGRLLLHFPVRHCNCGGRCPCPLERRPKPLQPAVPCHWHLRRRVPAVQKHEQRVRVCSSVDVGEWFFRPRLSD
jgi:hypothetical protein